MSEMILGLAFLVGGGLVISYAYSSILFARTAGGATQQLQPRVFRGFERRETTCHDRRKRAMVLPEGMQDRRTSAGRRAADRHA